MKVKELREQIELIKKTHAFHFNRMVAEHFCGTVPNNRMNKASLEKLLQLSLAVVETVKQNQIQMIPKTNQFECPICYNDADKGLAVCFDYRHRVCHTCYQQQKEHSHFSCALCKQSRFDNVIIECYEDDRPNLNKQHIHDIMELLTFTEQQRIKWLTFTMTQQNDRCLFLVVTDRYRTHPTPNDIRIKLIKPKKNNTNGEVFSSDSD